MGDILAGTVSIRTIRPFCTTNQAKDITSPLPSLARPTLYQSPNPNYKTYFELSALHSILCIYITSHSFGVNVVAMDFFGNKKYSESTFFHSGLLMIARTFNLCQKTIFEIS